MPEDSQRGTITPLRLLWMWGGLAGEVKEDVARNGWRHRGRIEMEH